MGYTVFCALVLKPADESRSPVHESVAGMMNARRVDGKFLDMNVLHRCGVLSDGGW